FARRAIEIGEIHRSRHELRVDLERRTQFSLGDGVLAGARRNGAQIEMRLGAIGIDTLGRDVLLLCALATRLLLRRQRIDAYWRKQRYRRQAYVAHGIA